MKAKIGYFVESIRKCPTKIHLRIYPPATPGHKHPPLQNIVTTQKVSYNFADASLLVLTK